MDQSIELVGGIEPLTHRTIAEASWTPAGGFSNVECPFPTEDAKTAPWPFWRAPV
jgi:hypothetical protein